jgi:hypothetical protein
MSTDLELSRPTVAPRAPAHFAEVPERYPRQSVAAALVVGRNGHERVEPVIVIDFYREHGQP